VITQGSKTVIRGTGMIYDKGQETFTLLKNVKVHYEKPASIKNESPNKKANEKDTALQHKNKPSKIPADTKKKKR
ncbi:MAG: LPS export ABC transporter periplasmic protein LptC, partial [Candidatus Methylopumilus sp.]|nr:LPS export ABC transporter periplasmic protein LptC [Candidatus Methylopumilus sp.]